MARFSVDLLFILMFCATYSSALSLEEKLQELEIKLGAKVNNVEAKNIQLEEKVARLETQLELNDELRKDLTLKVTKLEDKNDQLEVKVQEQEKILFWLLQAVQHPEDPGSGSIVLNNREIAIGSSGKSGTPRTCRELRAGNPSLPSGMQWIDPDGQGIGDGPIYVYCNMTTGSTSILHDSESPVDVGHCADPGCYSRPINYNASIGQMKSLSELSAECHQSFTYDCNFAPFELNGIAYSWWNDRDGNAQYFWAGNNMTAHTCQCGIDGNCIDSAVKCNCDTLAPIPLVDDGFITDKNVLPVTRLNFGRTQLATSSGIHTLGRFECTGSVALTRMPISCDDLSLIGHTLNGFYNVMGTTMMESVYCDFTKLPSDAGFEKWIGYTDVKSASAHFYVQRSLSFSTCCTPIPFDLALVNDGNAMNLTSGTFTAPRPGTYFFSFTGLASFPASTSIVYLAVGLYLNGGLIGSSHVEESNSVAGQDSPLTLQSTLNLKKGDQVWLSMGMSQSTGVFLYDNNNQHWTHFTGFMLEEQIVASLI